MSILIVDDDMVLARALSRALEALGYESRRACSVEDAMHALAAERPGLLLTDYDLAEACNGVDLAEWAKNALGVPVVLMTGHAVEWVQAALLHAGLPDVEVLAKPFTLEGLGAVVARHQLEPDADPWSAFEQGGRRHVT